jgi:hypothetical protein
MATYREVINEVLGVLSEDEIDPSATDLTSDYHKLVGRFVNQIKEEIEDAHNWSVLWQTLQVSIPGQTDNADINGANQRSRLVRVQQSNSYQEEPLVFDITIPTQARQLKEIDYSEMLYKKRAYGDTSVEAPIFFSTRMGSDGVPEIVVYPTPLNTRVLSVTMVVPQDRLAPDDLETVILIPSRPLEMGAIWYALHERGEELGVNSLYTEERYRNALDAAVARDWAEQGGLDLVAK